VNYIYEINLPELIINTIGEVGANVSEQLLELLAKHELVSRMQPKLTNDSPHKATTTGQDFVCDLPHGIFMAKSLQGHQQLVNHIERLLKFGLLNMPCFWPGATTATASTLVSAASLTQASTFALQLTPPVFMSDEARQQVIKDFKQLVKGKYAAGTPMTLPDALHEYCRFKNRKPSKDEVSRVRIVAKDLNNPYMHELSSEHFSNYENKLIRDLGGRTVEERIALIKRIYELLRSKRTCGASKRSSGMTIFLSSKASGLSENAIWRTAASCGGAPSVSAMPPGLPRRTSCACRWGQGR